MKPKQNGIEMKQNDDPYRTKCIHAWSHNIIMMTISNQYKDDDDHFHSYTNKNQTQP